MAMFRTVTLSYLSGDAPVGRVLALPRGSYVQSTSEDRNVLHQTNLWRLFPRGLIPCCLDYFQIGGHDLTLGFRPQVNRDDIYDCRTDRAVHYWPGKAHVLVHCEVGQYRRDGRTPNRALVVDEAGGGGSHFGREAFR